MSGTKKEAGPNADTISLSTLKDVLSQLETLTGQALIVLGSIKKPLELCLFLKGMELKSNLKRFGVSLRHSSAGLVNFTSDCIESIERRNAQAQKSLPGLENFASKKRFIAQVDHASKVKFLIRYRKLAAECFAESFAHAPAISTTPQGKIMLALIRKQFPYSKKTSGCDILAGFNRIWISLIHKKTEEKNA